MQEDFNIFIPFSVYSHSAVSAARRYVTLMEAQLSQAHSDDIGAALTQYNAVLNPDEEDYEEVRWVDRVYEDEFLPILRHTSVVYLYMVFETYVSRDVSGIQRILQGDPAILRKLKAKNKCGLAEAAQIYFRDHTELRFFTDEEWTQLQEIAHVRHCIIHDAGVPRDTKHRTSIYALETRDWQGQPVGLQVDRYKGCDQGQPMVLQQRFLEYCLSVLEHFFLSLGAAADAKFSK